MDVGEDYFIECFVDTDVSPGRLWFLVKWLNRSEVENTWLDLEQIFKNIMDKFNLLKTSKSIRGYTLRP